MDNNFVCKAVLKLHSKSCELDIIPTKLVKAHLDYFIDAYTKIVNLSLKTGEFYDDWKSVLLRPLQKKKGIDMSYVKYRPVSNLSFLSKLVEKCVLIQFNNHLKLNTLNVEQSAHKEGHSCETQLMTIHNDILWAMEHQYVNAMLLLDLSAAFNMVDHSVLVNILKNKYDINDVDLFWFKNYLQDHRFCVVVEDMISQERTISFSALQGSLLGPVLFNCYCSTLHEEIPKTLQINGYADDHSMQISFKLGMVQVTD